MESPSAIGTLALAVVQHIVLHNTETQSNFVRHVLLSTEFTDPLHSLSTCDALYSCSRCSFPLFHRAAFARSSSISLPLFLTQLLCQGCVLLGILDIPSSCYNWSKTCPCMESHNRAGRQIQQLHKVKGGKAQE